MRLQRHLFDFGQSLAIQTNRGPFRHAVVHGPRGNRFRVYRPSNVRRRVPVKIKRRMVAMLTAWARRTIAHDSINFRIRRRRP